MLSTTMLMEIMSQIDAQVSSEGGGGEREDVRSSDILMCYSQLHAHQLPLMSLVLDPMDRLIDQERLTQLLMVAIHGKYIGAMIFS